jgi:pimeloyl-ACP methyl ester carboxylesterase
VNDSATASDPAELGWTIVLPGIEGDGPVSRLMVRGLRRAGRRERIELVDWTTGFMPLFLHHLSARERNERVATDLAERIADYQRRHPGRPVNLVGHSGGGAMALLVAARLPPGHRLRQVVLLGAAISPGHDVASAARRVEGSIWNFHSTADVLLLGAGTILFGTVDRRHEVAAGNLGFPGAPAWNLAGLKRDGGGSEPPPVINIPWEPAFARHGYLAGHFGFVVPGFVAAHVSPCLDAPLRHSPAPEAAPIR